MQSDLVKFLISALVDRAFAHFLEVTGLAARAASLRAEAHRLIHWANFLTSRTLHGASGGPRKHSAERPPLGHALAPNQRVRLQLARRDHLPKLLFTHRPKLLTI